MAKTVGVYWASWVCDLRFTWCLVLLISVLPGLLYGASIFSMVLLLGGVILGVPTLLAAWLLMKDFERRALLFRRVAVFSVVPALMLAVIFQADKLTPQMATPIARAIESFKQEKGTYPESLADISSEYLKVIPNVRFSVFQPEIIYNVQEGNPYLAVPSAAGDAYSVYRYDFKERVWLHYN